MKCGDFKVVNPERTRTSHHNLHATAELVEAAHCRSGTTHRRVVRRGEELLDLSLSKALLTAANLVVVSTDCCNSLGSAWVVEIVANAYRWVALGVCVDAFPVSLMIRDEGSRVAARLSGRRKDNDTNGECLKHVEEEVQFEEALLHREGETKYQRKREQPWSY